MKNEGMRVAYATDPRWYTVMYRKKGSRRFYCCGYRSLSLEEMRDLAYSEIRDGKYAAARIVNWATEEVIETVM